MREGDVRQPKRVAVLITAMLLAAAAGAGDPIEVRYTEGLVHGYLTLRTLDGAPIASGELTQTASGTRVVSRLVFHFKDGSLDDETTVFSQHGRFRLVTDHLVQHGPSFPTAVDMTIDTAKPDVHVRYTDEHGETHDEDDSHPLPSDVSNGLIPVLLKNVTPRSTPKTISFVAATPKPRLVKLAISRAGSDRFSVSAAAAATATEYVLKVEVGGFAGLLAPLVGKQPPDSRVWIAAGATPAFLKSEQPLYVGGPVWRIELASPVWPKAAR
jgi:hypothetical protein